MLDGEVSEDEFYDTDKLLSLCIHIKLLLKIIMSAFSRMGSTNSVT